MTPDDAIELEALALALVTWAFDDPRTIALKQRIFLKHGLVLRGEDLLNDDVEPTRLVPPTEALVGYIKPTDYDDDQWSAWAPIDKLEGTWMITLEDPETGKDYMEPVLEGTPIYVTHELKYQFGVV